MHPAVVLADYRFKNKRQMACRSLYIVLVVLVISVCGYHDELEAESKAKEAMAAEKDQKNARSALPGREKGSFQKLHSLMNRTSDRKEHRRKGKDNMSKILNMNRNHKVQNDNMMNDNEGALVEHQIFYADNDTNAYTTKLKELRPPRPNYEAFYKSVVPQVTGVLCTFEPSENVTENEDMCQWTWNSTVSKYNLGFEVMTAEDVVRKNESAQYQFTGPSVDADNNTGGHFLYLPVDPSMENMVIKSPPFRGLREECKFEASFHQSNMQNASIRLISESTGSSMQWILMEVAGNNLKTWHKMSFLIGKVRQEVRIMIEITRPSGVSLNSPLPHIAADNIRMPECLPETPRYNGQCPMGHIKCLIMNRTSCIKQQQICDLVRDCDDGSDENQNCDKMPFGSYCNFENDMCGFVNIPQPILKWTRNSGPTPTDKTGPNFDHTCGAPDYWATDPSVPLIPPLTPAHLNHTDPKCMGYYMYVNMNVTGPNKEKADFASTAIVRSATFNPPPRVHGDLNSKYYNCCMIRFYYQQNGRNAGSLSVDLYEISAWNRSIPLWFTTKDKGDKWHRAAIFLPNITRRYYLEFKTRRGMRVYSDTAIDDISLAPECFGLNIPSEELGDYNYYEPVLEENVTTHYAFKAEPVYRFTPCGATGRHGPTQAMCDAAYNGSRATELPAALAGVQVWEVPAEGYYTIIARGASGGYGSAWAGVSRGAAARGLFELHRGELLHLLVGQQGGHACKKTLSAQESPECSWRANETARYTSKAHEVRNTQVRDGGGGGGGGTYVFLMDKENKMHPLIIAGGGGGLSVGVFRDDGSQHGRRATNATPDHGYMYGDPGSTSGAGAGWASRPGPSTPGFEVVRGASPREGGAGGAACAGGAHGGYGGGGGGCRKGGGGGGWIGGSTNDGLHGGGGYSFLSTARAVPEFGSVAVAQHTGHGEVLIVQALHACDCAYRCVALNEFRSEVSCFCPSAWKTRNGTGCILDGEWERMSWLMVIGMVGLFILLLVLVTILCLYLYNLYQRKKEAEIRRKQVLDQELALQRLRNPPGGEGTLSAFNPHYGSAALLPPGIDALSLPRLERGSLSLLKALGQGAFGEVYQGLYQHRAGGDAATPVAVKTLPELSTEQAESDFFMEAAIMAKFNHPNIVHLIGVCFDRHPRFIVLELLAGGDLKNFLRESRPRPERASALTMKELLMCAIDVCKGCRYLEVKRFIHRDIAARNCLLTTRGPGRVVKIADFGMARDIYRADYYKKGGKAMLPIKWMPPEAYMDGLFTVKTDVWSFGVLIWEVFSLGIMPYTGCTNREVMDMVSGGGRLDKPYGCPPDIYRLMCECWNPTPEERPSFSHMHDKLTLFLQDPEIISAPLPIVRTALAPIENNGDSTSQRAPPCDYLVPMSPNAASNTDSPTDPLASHSRSLTATPDTAPLEDSQYPHQLKASQEYGNIPTGGAGARGRLRDCRASDDRGPARSLQSNSTDRLLSSAESASLRDSGSEAESEPVVVWETSFVQRPPPPDGPAVDKLISITPTSPKPPENVLTNAIDSTVLDKTNHKPATETKNNKTLAPDAKNAPIASPDPPRINAWPEPPKPTKPKPLCLDAAQLEQNLNALKKNSGSVNLNTMNILPPYINVVTPNKLSESKTIQIDPKKAVIYDLQSPKEEQKEETKLKQSNSAASLLNGPMTDVPYADSDNASSSSSSNPPNHITKIQKSKQNNYSEVKIGLKKQTSNGGDFHDSEISC